MTNMEMFTGDTKPDLEITLSNVDDNGIPIPDKPFNVSSANELRVVGKRGNTVVFSRLTTAYEIVGDTSVVTMPFEAGDLDVVGQVVVDVAITWPGDAVQTVRSCGVIDVRADNNPS